MALMKGFTLVFRLMVFLFMLRVTLRGAVSMPHTVVGVWGSSQGLIEMVSRWAESNATDPAIIDSSIHHAQTSPSHTRKRHVPRAWGNFLSFDPSSYDLTTTAFFPA